jgi:hypothetical protein
MLARVAVAAAVAPKRNTSRRLIPLDVIGRFSTFFSLRKRRAAHAYGQPSTQKDDLQDAARFLSSSA